MNVFTYPLDVKYSLQLSDNSGGKGLANVNYNNFMEEVKSKVRFFQPPSPTQWELCRM